jgi:hypothetical protein
MDELDVIKLKGTVCVDIKQMTLDQWKLFKGQIGFIYRAYQKGFHQFTIGK